MKLSESRDAYLELSAKASENARSLAFAGIALIWIFKTDGTLKVPQPLLVPAVLFAITLFLDLLQYSIGTAIYGFRSRHEERKLKNVDVDLEKVKFNFSKRWNWPALICFWGKLGTVAAAYYLVIRYIAGLWVP